MTRKNIIYGIVAIAILVTSAIIVRNLAFSSKDIRVIHTVSYSNAVIFRTIQKFPERIQGVSIPDPAKHIDILLGESSRRAIVSVTPFSNALIAADRNRDLRIIAGAGFNGLSLIGNVKTVSELRGKRIGTSRGDTLENFLVELMQENGLTPEDYEIVYFTDPFEAIESVRRGLLDAVTHVEPFATQLLEQSGLYRIATSKELWGDHPDAVIITSQTVIDRFPQYLQWLIDELKKTQKEIIENPEKTAAELSNTYYDLDKKQLMQIIQYQFPRIDIRNYESFFIERGNTLLELRYIDNPVSKTIFDWRFLNNEK